MVTFYRRLPKFDYVKPRSLEETLGLLKDEKNGPMRVYAGGTDVIPKLKNRSMPAPSLLIDLKGITDLDYIQYDQEKGLRIGALATIASVAHHPLVRQRFAALSKGADSIASTQIQSRGTIVGNLCSALPSADSAPALLCLNARLACVSPRGERIVELKDFFTGPMQTVLAQDELVREIVVPPLPEGGRGTYLKLSLRRRMDLAVLGVAVVGEVSDGVFRDIRIGLGSAATTPIRARQAEEALMGEKATDEIIAEAGRVAAASSSPRTSYRASAEYRRLMVEVLVKRAIKQALNV